MPSRERVAPEEVAHMRRLALIPAGLSLCAGLFLAACGGGSPTAPSDAPAARGVTLSGTLQGSGGTASLHSLSSAAVALVVTVRENPAITTTVGADGSFTLRGLPEGGFTLVFTLDGRVLAELRFDDVRPNQEITIVVRLDGSTVTLTEQKRNGIGHGDVEIEGLVEAVIVADPTGESRFTIDGHAVVARPGDTAIREGNRARSVNDLTVGRRVHVKGTWMPAQARGQQDVLAQEIKLQGPQTAPSPTPPPTSSSCPTGANTQVEGLIQSKNAAAIVVRQQGKGDFQCDVSASTRIRKGNTTYTLAQLQPGWRVHVSGQGLGSSGAQCRVRADEIKVQQD
jgi:hypothetical protein